MTTDHICAEIEKLIPRPKHSPSPYTSTQILAIIAEMEKQGISYRTAEERYLIPKSTLQRYRSKWKKQGLLQQSLHLIRSQPENQPK